MDEWDLTGEPATPEDDTARRAGYQEGTAGYSCARHRARIVTMRYLWQCMSLTQSSLQPAGREAECHRDSG